MASARTTASRRRYLARRLREEAAESAFLRWRAQEHTNGEEEEYRNAAGPNYIANYSKGLPHQAPSGEVVQDDYLRLLRALERGDPQGFELIRLATLAPGERHRRLTNPQAGLAFDLQGADCQTHVISPPPRIDQPQVSSEMGELYWMALRRDVCFHDYGTGAGTDAGPPTTIEAATSLSTEFSDYRGPATSAATARQTLFRGTTPGDLLGPYISQFLVKDVPYNRYTIQQRGQTAAAGQAFVIVRSIWRDIHNGAEPNLPITLDPTPRYLRNLRDLTYLVRVDVSFQHYLNACLILQHMNVPPTVLPAGPGLTGVDAPPCMSGPLDHGNPYFPPGFPPIPPHTEDGFVTFGNWHIPSLLAEAAIRGLKAAWYQKWYVHRRLRPEDLGWLIDRNLTAGATYPVDSEIITSLTTAAGGLNPYFPTVSYLLPQAYPEGSPLHPSYPEGHATTAAACVTILKAWFDESYHFNPASTNPFEVPQEANCAGTALLPYAGTLTVGGELNKLASNISIGGRSGAGVHFRSDYVASLQLGEAVALDLLREQKQTYNEDFSFTLTTFGGTRITI